MKPGLRKIVALILASVTLFGSGASAVSAAYADDATMGRPTRIQAEPDVKTTTGGDVAPPDPLIAMASESMRMRALTDHTQVKSASETRGLLDMADHVEYGPDGAILYDGDGNILFREDPSVPGLDSTVMRHDPKTQAAVRAAFQADLGEYPPAGSSAIPGSTRSPQSSA